MSENLIQILYYLNIGLAFFSLLEFIALIVLCAKTAYMRAFGGVCAGLTIAGALLAVIQLALKATGVAGAAYASLIAFAVIVCAYASVFIYLILSAEKKL